MKMVGQFHPRLLANPAGFGAGQRIGVGLLQIRHGVIGGVDRRQPRRDRKGDADAFEITAAPDVAGHACEGVHLLTVASSARGAEPQEAPPQRAVPHASPMQA